MSSTYTVSYCPYRLALRQSIDSTSIVNQVIISDMGHTVRYRERPVSHSITTALPLRRHSIVDETASAPILTYRGSQRLIREIVELGHKIGKSPITMIKLAKTLRSSIDDLQIKKDGPSLWELEGRVRDLLSGADEMLNSDQQDGMSFVFDAIVSLFQNM